VYNRLDGDAKSYEKLYKFPLGDIIFVKRYERGKKFLRFLLIYIYINMNININININMNINI
jgi:hypothetical protein